MNKKRRIIPNYVKDILSYNHETGDFTWVCKSKNRKKVFMKKAGCTVKGYAQIRINYIYYMAHRIAWFIVNNTQPLIIDHINGNTSDNRISNLREASNLGNSQNHKLSTNKSGLPCGVRLTSNGKYQARITYNKIVIHLGTFDTSNKAEKAYNEKRITLFGNYARK